MIPGGIATPLARARTALALDVVMIPGGIATSGGLTRHAGSREVGMIPGGIATAALTLDGGAPGGSS